MFNLPFTLSNDAKANKDTAATAHIDFNHTYQLDNNSALQSGVSLGWTDYRDIDRLDALTLAASSGPIWQFDKRTVLSLPLSISRVHYGDTSETWFSRSTSLIPSLRFKLNGTLTLSTVYSLGETQYQGNAQRNANVQSLTPKLIWAIDQRSSLSNSIAYGRFDSKSKTSSHTYWAANSTYQRALGNDDSLSFTVSYRNTDYDGIELAFSKGRADDFVSLSGNYVLAVKAIDAAVVFTVNVSDNNSNHALYDYDRAVLSVGIQKRY